MLYHQVRSRYPSQAEEAGNLAGPNRHKAHDVQERSLLLSSSFHSVKTQPFQRGSPSPFLLFLPGCTVSSVKAPPTLSSPFMGPVIKNKIYYFHSMEYLSIKKKKISNEVLMYAMITMNLKIFTLSKRSRARRPIVSDGVYIKCPEKANLERGGG